MLVTLEAQRNLLKNQIAAEQERMKSEQARLTALIGGLKTEVSELQSEIETQNEGIKVSKELVSSVTGLRAKGLISEPEYRKRELAALEQKQKLNSLNQQLADRENQLTESRYSLEQLPTVMADKVQSLRNELATTEQRIAEITGRRAYVIRAPADGRISTLQATVGQFADPQRPQLEIIPSESVLQAELFVPTRAIGFVRTRTEGQNPLRGVPVSTFRHVRRPSKRGLADPPDQVRRLRPDRAQGARLPGHGRARPAGHRRLRQARAAPARHASESRYHSREALAYELAD